MAFEEARSWPFQEARRLLAHIQGKGKVPGDLVTFETGYGPSGAPHIGTFGEVARTLWVMRAFRAITEDRYPTRLILFSDDYDALRRVPDDMPESMRDYLGYRLTAVPSPYDDSLLGSSFGMANNSKLVDFVSDILGSYDNQMAIIHTDKDVDMSRPGIYFCSSTNFYRNSRFDESLLNVWRNHQAVLDILLPTFGADRRETYCAFMPLQGPPGQLDIYVKEKTEVVPDWEGHVVFTRDGIRTFSPVTHGMTKLQWYVDWAMRWTHFDVDYEMSGKDLIDSVRLSSEICGVLGGTPPLNLTYELFLDEQGAKISKSKGNGLTVERWLRYGTTGSLMLFMFQNPRAAKRLHADVVPQLEDQYLQLRSRTPGPDDPHWHFSTRAPKPLLWDISYGLLLNLALVAQTRDSEQLMRYLEENRHVGPRDRAQIVNLAARAIRYAEDKGLFNRPRRAPTELERAAFRDLANRLDAMMPAMDAEHYQFQVYEVGKAHGFQPLRSWFSALYECLLGSSSGPRFGAFVAAYGLKNVVGLLREVGSEDS